MYLYPYDQQSLRERIDLLRAQYPDPPRLQRGVALWTGSFRCAEKQRLKLTDILIGGNGAVYRNPLAPDVVKPVLPGASAYTFSIALAGMGGVTHRQWQEHAFDTSISKTMLAQGQWDAMVELFAFASLWFDIPLSQIRTRAEYAQLLGYFPRAWDFEGWGDILRTDIRLAQEKILELFPGLCYHGANSTELIQP